MKYKILVLTDTFSADKLPHVVVTSANSMSSFNEVKIEYRENKYKDVMGILVESEKVELSDKYIKQATWMANTLNKNQVFLVQGEYLVGWLFYKDNDIVTHKKIQAHSTNDINFDIWPEEQNSLWNPIDFLLENVPAEQPLLEGSSFFDVEDAVLDLNNTLKKIEEKINFIYDSNIK